MPGTDGDEHEVNLVYSINKNFAAFAGWNRIKNSFKDGVNYSNTNNIAQIGLIAKAPLANKLDFYAKGALGTQRTAMWEAGLGYSVTPDLDINAGYRYLNTKLADQGEKALGGTFTDDANISYKEALLQVFLIVLAAATKKLRLRNLLLLRNLLQLQS